MTDDDASRPRRALDDPIEDPDPDRKVIRPARALTAEETAAAAAITGGTKPDAVASDDAGAGTTEGATAEAREDVDVEDTAEAPAPAAGSGGATRPPTRRRRGWKAFGWIVGILLLVVALAIGGLVFRAHTALQDITRNSSFLPTSSGRPSAPARGGPMNFVLLGSDNSNIDTRQEGQRSDTIMVAHLPKNRQHMYLISVPRDLWVPVPDVGYAKVNAAFDENGVPGTVGVLEEILDVRMDHVGVVDFNGFIELMDVLGGIDVYNTVESDYWYEGDPEPLYHFPVGKIHLEGQYGLAYVRQRHELPNGDLDRTARQRLVIKAIVSKAMSRGVLTNPVTMNDFLGKVTKVVQVDHELDEGEIIGLATSLKFRSGDDIRTMMLPIAGYDTASDGQSIDVPDVDALAELQKAMQTDTMDAYWSKNSSLVANPDVPPITDNRAWPEGEAPEPGSDPSPWPTPSAMPTATPSKHRGSAIPSPSPSTRPS